MPNYDESLISDILSNRSGKTIEFQNGDFWGTEAFKRSSYTAIEMKFINCKFSKRLMISDKHFKNGISFINCEFLDGLSLESISSTDDRPECAIKIISSKSSADVIISECKFQYIDIQLKINTAALICLNTEARAELNLNEIQAHRVNINKVKSETITVNQLECKNILFYKNEYWSFHVEDSSLRFLKSSIFNSSWQSAVYSISFRDCTLYNFNLPLIPENEQVTLSFEYNNFKKECSILTPDHIQGGRRNNESVLEKMPNYILFLKYNNSEHPIAIGNLNAQIQNSIFLKSRRYNICSYEISNTTVRELNLSGDCTNTQILLDGINIHKKIEYNTFTGGEGSKFSNLFPNNEGTALLFKNSTFNKSVFSDIKFDKFKIIEMISSQFRAAIFDNVKWFEKDQVSFGYKPKDNRKQYYKDCRTLFNQLKQSSEKNDDKPTALYFHSLEEKNHLHELIGAPKFEIIRLFLKSTNDFGNKWLKPIVLLIALSFITSYLLLYFSNKDLNVILYPYFSNLTVQLLNPTHSLKEIVESSDGLVKLSFINNLIDILHKTFTTFLIFQTITAFRRQHT